MKRGTARKPSRVSDSQRLYSNTACALLLAGAVAGATAIGCGWSFINEHSVRFSGYSSGDFTRLPPLPININSRREDMLRARSEGEEEEYEAGVKREKEMRELWSRAGAAEEENDFAQTGVLLREYLQRVSAEKDFLTLGAEGRQLRRNSAIDRLDALTALGQGVKRQTLNVYLAIRRDYDLMLLWVTDAHDSWYYGDKRSETSGSELAISHEDLRQKLDAIERHPALADNFAYLRAALLFREDKWDEAANAFTELAVRYPRSEKREAALLMAGLARVKRFEQTLQEAVNEADHASQKALLAARRPLQQCLNNYPRGRFALDARGWLARLSFLEGDRAAALVEYYRLLAEATDAPTRQSLLNSLRMTRDQTSDDEIRQVESELADEPAAALIYAYQNIYNFTPRRFPDLGDRSDEDDETDESDESDETNEQEEDSSRRAERQEQERIVAFAANLLRRYPNSAVGAGFALRLAQAQLELGDHKAALQFSVRALRLGAKDRERLEAMWVKGASEWRLRDYSATRRTMKHLIAEFPQSDLAEGAGSLIAMAAEDAGDLDGALEQYIAMNYEDDFAYFVDVFMTPEQLAGFIARHPDSPRLNNLNYALAVRYLRAKRWEETRAALARVKVTEEGYAEVTYPSEKDDSVEFRSKSPTVKTPSASRGIAARWLWRDLKTVEDLERLEREAAAAQGDAAKAEALYQIASYLYQSSSLLFYNPSLWNGARHYKLEELESGNGYRAPGEAQLLWRNAQEHEPVAHALEIYLDVARRFPNTRAARDALYTAAICHERLSDYNNHWRNVYGLGLHAGSRMITYKDVRRTYPDYQLPHGTIGWDPMTRTVYGGPAWAEAPKPKPRPTWRSRVKQRLTNLADNFRQKQRDVGARITELKDEAVTGLIYSLVGIFILAACYFAVVVLYIKNQRPVCALMIEEERIAATASDWPTSSTDSRVEKIINDA